MLDTFRSCADGMTKNEIVETLRRNEVNRGLTFEYCLITAGTSQNRAPSDQQLKRGEILSLDSGGNYQGYIGDLCRMGILGEPDSELEDLLGFHRGGPAIGAQADQVRHAGRRNLCSCRCAGRSIAAQILH